VRADVRGAGAAGWLLYHRRNRSVLRVRVLGLCSARPWHAAATGSTEETYCSGALSDCAESDVWSVAFVMLGEAAIFHSVALLRWLQHCCGRDLSCCPSRSRGSGRNSARNTTVCCKCTLAPRIRRAHDKPERHSLTEADALRSRHDFPGVFAALEPHRSPRARSRNRRSSRAGLAQFTKDRHARDEPDVRRWEGMVLKPERC